VPITTEVVSSNPSHGAVYSIQLCQILAAGQRFFPGTPVSSTNEIVRHDIAEILLKVALIIITITSPIKENRRTSIGTAGITYVERVLSCILLFPVIKKILYLQFLNNVIIIKTKVLLPQA
jgi:hypothetical protein